MTTFCCLHSDAAPALGRWLVNRPTGTLLAGGQRTAGGFGPRITCNHPLGTCVPPPANHGNGTTYRNAKVAEQKVWHWRWWKRRTGRGWQNRLLHDTQCHVSQCGPAVDGTAIFFGRVIESSKSKGPSRVRAAQPNKVSQIGGQPILAFHRAHTCGHQRTGERPPQHRQSSSTVSSTRKMRNHGAKEVQNEPVHQQWRSQVQRLLGSICHLFPGPQPPIYSGLPQRVPGIFALSRRARCKTAPLVCVVPAQVPWAVNMLWKSAGQR